MSQANWALYSSAVHYVVGGLLVLAIVFFLWQFFLPGWRVGKELRAARARLEELKKAGPVLDLALVRDKAMPGERLQRCWDEFRDTLHAQKATGANGSRDVCRWRATAAANAFFSEQSLVDSPLRAEFYKHLPGILTGMGIIGTFSGLIIGLQAFGHTDLGDADAARNGLRTLLETVGGAFTVSGIAITAAMVVTYFEKQIINRRYTELEALCAVVDSLFDAGAGEEYLERLVDAAETSATQAMQMKESLVTDLKQVLTELTTQQITAMTVTSSQLGHSITSSLQTGLADPLERISHAVESVGNAQGDAVNRLLTDVLRGFMEQMESMFGSQMRGMSEMLVQTANTVKATSERFEQLAGQIQQAGSGAADAMASRIDQALQQMHQHQVDSHEQMRLFVEQLKGSVAQSQSESAELTLGMMRELSESSSGLIRALQQQADEQQRANEQRQAGIVAETQALMGRQGEAAREMVQKLGDVSGTLIAQLQQVTQEGQQQHAERQAGWVAHTDAVLDRQREHLENLTEAVQQATASMRDAVKGLQAESRAATERMATGSERLLGASNRLADNLEVMKAASDGVSRVADKLQATGATLNSAALAAQHAMADHRTVRDTFDHMVSDLKDTVDTAKREASMTAQLVGNLESAATKLSAAQSDANEYLNSVTDVLAAAHAEFGKQMENTMRLGNKVFHEELAQATGLLKGAIQDLSDVLDSLPQPA